MSPYSMADEERILVRNEENRDIEYGSTSSQPSTEVETKQLNEIYEDIGLGPTQYLYWTLVALVSYSDYAELTLLAVILPSLRCEWGLTENFEAAITISMYGSYALFAILFGKVADIYGRKTVIQWSTLVLLLAAIGGALSPNKWVFLATRLVTGACIGVNLNCIVCYGTEFAESKYRAFGVTLFVISTCFGTIAVSAEAFLFLRHVGWRWLITIVSLPAVPALVLILALPESPRFLCVSGQLDKAMRAVRIMAKINGKELKENIRMICFEEEDLGSYSKIVNQEHRKSTIALSVMYFSNIFFEFGIVVLLPLMLSSGFCGATVTPTHKCQPLSQRDLLEITIASTFAMFGVVAAFVFGQLVGRLLPLRVSSGLLILGITGLFICVNHFVTLVIVIVARTLSSSANATIWIMIPESFPTNIRSTATGFINGWGKLGGVLGTGCVYLVFYSSPYSVIGLFLLSSIGVFITSLVYDRETKDVILQET